MSQNTDPISAATAYRQALAAIAEARSLHVAQQRAAAALKITFAAPISDEIGVESGLGARTGTPFVSLSVSNPTIQLPSTQARQIAMQILEAADAAESDGFILGFIADLMEGESSPGHQAALLQAFRVYRQQLRCSAGHDHESEG